MGSILGMRAGQRRFMQLVDGYRVICFLARRQYGKTSTFAKIALKKMMKQRNHTVIFGSAKISLSREIVLKEAMIIREAITEAIAQAVKGRIEIVDAGTGRAPDALTPDDFADLFEHQRLEFRFNHSRSSYSRTKVVALNESTVGETGDLMCDEIGRVNGWRGVWEAGSPIIASNPDYRCLLATTIPPDDMHYSWEQLAPPPGMEFKPNPEGNTYESEFGLTVHRVDAWDAYADGIPLYNMKTGEAESPEENREHEHDKDAWDRNYGLKFVVGGTGACGLLQLQTAQERGVGQCAFFTIETDSDMDAAVHFIAEHTGDGPVGLGLDVATTTQKKSNPSAFAVVEQQGVSLLARAIVIWKTRDEEIAEERVRRLIGAVKARPNGGAAKKLCIDATNERYFASGLRKKLRADLPVECVVSSETVQKPGYEPMLKKQWLGDQLTEELGDNHLTLPPERYVKKDFRLVRKDRGIYVCEVDVDGAHGDTFDGVKLAIHALKGGMPPPPPKSFENNRRNKALKARRNRRIFA